MTSFYAATEELGYSPIRASALPWCRVVAGRPFGPGSKLGVVSRDSMGRRAATHKAPHLSPLMRSRPISPVGPQGRPRLGCASLSGRAFLSVCLAARCVSFYQLVCLCVCLPVCLSSPSRRAMGPTRESSGTTQIVAVIRAAAGDLGLAYAWTVVCFKAWDDALER